MCSLAVKDTNRRVTATIKEELYQQAEYWAAKKGISLNQYVAEAIQHMIQYENKDYDLPELEIARLNQLVDTITVLSSNVHSLEGVITSGFDSLLGLTRGDNYLLENEDGDI